MIKKKEKNEGKKLLLLIGFFLVVVFLLLILFTTTLKDIDVSYDFEDRVRVTSPESSFEIGELTLINNFFLPARVELDKIVACSYNGEGEFNNINLNMVSEKRQYSFNYYSGRNSYIDISGTDEENLSIVLSAYNLLRDVGGDDGSYLSTKRKMISTDVYIFNLGNSGEVRNYYDLCATLDMEDAVHKVFVDVGEDK